jgi:2'-5' RNA ligase
MCSHQQNNIRRLFFALWPQDELRQAIKHLNSKACPEGGKLVAIENVHITLSFLGPVDPHGYECLITMADTISAKAFTLVLNKIGHWPKPRVLWLGAEQSPPDLLQLVKTLNQGLQACNFQPDPRPFVPHMTLIRKVKKADPEDVFPPIQWQVNDFVLVESKTLPEGAQYTVLHRWPLKKSDENKRV